MSGHETFVVITDGKPTTVIKSKSKDDSNRKLPFKFSGKGKDNIDQIEAKRLKTENALLLNKIRVLEEELDTLTEQSANARKGYEQELQELKSNQTPSQQDPDDMTNPIKSFANAETQTFYLDLDSRTDINCNNITCLQCGSSLSSNVDLGRLVDQANRNSTGNRITLRIESPQITSPFSPQRSTLDDSCESFSCTPCTPVQQQVDETFQKLQEELVACKLREAESSLGFKELQQKVNQLGRQWQQFLKDSDHSKRVGDIKTQTLLDLREAIMALKIRETCMVSDFNELKQKLIDLETENNVSRRQAKRLQEELDKMEEKLSEASLMEDELVNEKKELERRISDLNTKYQEDLIMFKIKDAERCQFVASLQRKVAEKEIENQELVTALKLSNPKHSEMFERIRSQHLNSQAGERSGPDASHDPARAQEKSSEVPDFQQNVLDLLSRCDMSDIMTESFIADTMFLQPASLLIGEAPSSSSSLCPTSANREADARGSFEAGNLQSVDCDSLERLNE